MAQETRKITPPRHLATVVGLLTPRAFRTALLVRLALNYTSLWDCIGHAAEGIRRTTMAQSIQAFNPLRLFGDLCCLYVAFYTLPVLPLIALLAVAAAVLIWHDGYIDPPQPTAAEAGTDALVLAPFIVASQIIISLGADSATPHTYGLWTGLAMGMAMISGWRFVFRMTPPPSDPVLPDSYRAAWRVNAVWAAGFLGLLVANTKIVSEPWNKHENLYVFIPLALLFLDIRMQSNAIGGMMSILVVLSPFGNYEKLELEAKENKLLRGQSRPPSGWTWSSCFEPLLLLSLVLPIVSAGAAALLGRIPPESVNWMQLVANTAALAALSWIWVEVKNINRRAARDIQEQIDKLGKGSAT